MTATESGRRNANRTSHIIAAISLTERLVYAEEREFQGYQRGVLPATIDSPIGAWDIRRFPLFAQDSGLVLEAMPSWES